MGRFLNADALISTGQGVLGNNMFAYCNNNPVCNSDTTGYMTDALDGFRQKACTQTILDGGGTGGAVSLYASFIVIDVITGGITMADDWLDELIDTIVEKLSKSLAKSGRPEYKTEFEEHHIAAKKALNAKRAASILEEVLPGGVEDPLNKVMLKTSVHRRIHTSAYYLLVNSAIISAYNKANGNPQQQRENVVKVLGAIQAFLTGLNVLSTN